MKFTKKQRHSIYEKVLSLLDKQQFICNAILNVLQKEEIITDREARIFRNGYDNEILTYFPEINKQKPNDLFGRTVWFDTDEEGIKKRVQIVKKAIQLTKPNSNVKSGLRKRVVKRSSVRTSRKRV